MLWKSKKASVGGNHGTALRFNKFKSSVAHGCCNVQTFMSKLL